MGDAQVCLSTVFSVKPHLSSEMHESWKILCVGILHWHLQEETGVYKMNSGLGVNTTISFSNPISYRLWLNISLKGANKYRCGVNTKDGKICSVAAEVQFEG